MAKDDYTGDPIMDEELRKLRRNAYGIKAVRDAEPLMDRLFESIFHKKEKVKEEYEARMNKEKLRKAAEEE